MKADTLDTVAYWLVLIGGLNWGLIGLFDYNLVAELFGADSGISKLIYILVGLSAAYLVYKLMMARTPRKRV